MTDAHILTEAKDSLWYWKLYYHVLLYLHFVLGILGVVIGALIAADLAADTSFPISTKWLGILSTVIVGIVSFVQPGRMASVFYDAYWRLRIAVLQSHVTADGTEDVIAALSNGYTTVATIQPEALRKHKEGGAALDTRTLSEERRTKIEKMYAELVAEEEADAAAAIEKKYPNSPPPGS